MKRTPPRSSTLDLLDAKIIGVLQRDGRMPNTEIARRLGVAEATVRKRIARLLRENVMQIGAWAEPLKIGYTVYTHIEIQVKPPEINRVAEALVKFPEIHFLGITTGGFDITCAAIFRSSEHMYEFMTNRLCRVSGIVRTSTASIIRILKREYTYPVQLAGLGVDGTGRSRESDAPLRRRRKRAKR